MRITKLTPQGPEKIHVVSRPRYLISKHFEDADYLCDVLKDFKLSPVIVPAQWPRDLCTYWNNRFITIDQFPNLGEEGNYVFGKDYCIASPSAFEYNDLGKHKLVKMGNRREDRSSNLKRGAQFLSEFFDFPVYVVETPSRGGDGVACSMHADLYMLALPETRRLIVDQRVYKENKELFETIAKNHLEDLIVHDSKKEFSRFPHNCIVLPGEIVIANENTPRFLSLLDELKVGYVPIDADVSYRLEGSIRCRTHSVPNLQLVEYLKRIQDQRYAFLRSLI